MFNINPTLISLPEVSFVLSVGLGISSLIVLWASESKSEEATATPGTSHPPKQEKAKAHSIDRESQAILRGLKNADRNRRVDYYKHLDRNAGRF